MSFRWPDRIWALTAGSVLFGAALFVLFVIHPGGFEGQIGWALVLMPATFLILPLADKIFRVLPTISNILFWPMLITFNLLWYCAMSYVVIKLSRLVVRVTR